MSVWVCVPSARPFEEVWKWRDAWRRQGYKIALWRDNDLAEFGKIADVIAGGVAYPGYAAATNELVKAVLSLDPKCDWVVGGGDDVFPDPHHRAEEIAAECREHFGATPRLSTVNIAEPTRTVHLDQAYETFGVMQPTGDRFAGGSIDRICGSPWMGREFCLRINKGRGPMWQGDPSASNPLEREGYTHMYPDEEILEVCKRLNILWQRRDLVHLHRHFQRETDDLNSNAVPQHTVTTPPWLREATSREHWDKYSLIFRNRKLAGFPGHEPLPAYATGGVVEAGVPRLVGE